MELWFDYSTQLGFLVVPYLLKQHFHREDQCLAQNQNTTHQLILK